MSAGKRNRLVTIQRRVTSATDTGSRNVSWETFAQVYAEKRDNKTGASENTMSSTQYPILRAEWVIRFLPGITPSMRVVYEGETWEIINIADDSFRRDYKVLLCELRGNGSTSGGLTCQPATYQNAAEDATFTQTIQSGAVFTADPITVTEVDGSTRTELANEDVTCAFIEIEVFDTAGTLIETVTEYPEDGRITVPAASGSATYSNGGEFEVEIDAGDTFTAPAIEVTDVDGSTRASLPNIGVVCEWATLQVQSSDGQQAVKNVTEYPAGGVVVVGDQSILDAENNSFTLPYRSSTIVNNALIATAVNDTPIDGYHNLTIEVNVPVVNSAGDGVGGNVDDLLNPHPLPDVPLTDDNGAVGSYPMPTAIVINGEVDSAAYSAGTLTITPAGGSLPIVPEVPPISQFTSYGVRDEGWAIANGYFNVPIGISQGIDLTAASPWTTIKHAHLGSTARFRDTSNNPLAYGDPVTADNIVRDYRIDWEFYTLPFTNGAGFLDICDKVAALTIGGHTDWVLVPRAVLFMLWDMGSNLAPNTVNGRPPGFNSNWMQQIITGTTNEQSSGFVINTFGTAGNVRRTNNTPKDFAGTTTYIVGRRMNSY